MGVLDFLTLINTEDKIWMKFDQKKYRIYTI